MQRINLTYKESGGRIKVGFNVLLTKHPEPFEIGRAPDGFKASSFRPGDLGIMRILVRALFENKFIRVFYVHVKENEMTIEFSRFIFVEDVKDFIHQTLSKGQRIVTVS